MKNPHKKHSQAWHEQEDHTALFRLYVRGIITESERDKARRRMMKRHAFEAAAAAPTPREDGT